MKPILLIDFGSTYTKVTAVDVEGQVLLGAASSYSTVHTDIGEGLLAALDKLHALTGPLEYTSRLACSSAAGGLRMVTSGLVAELTAEAARLASLGAGAKVVKAYSQYLTNRDIAEIEDIAPDIFLLTGGTDGGNSACILHNAQKLADCKGDFPILLAGNRAAADACEQILRHKNVYVCDNVMPRLNELNIQPVQAVIRELFLQRIVFAKGLDKAQQYVSGILMPTPAAVLCAMQLLANGLPGNPGYGDLLAVDLGGATTDVYSMATGLPQSDNVLLKGLREPYAKRTVEGDLGMRYSAQSVLAAAGAEQLSQLSGVPPGRVVQLVEQLAQSPKQLAGDEEMQRMEYALASSAVQIAAVRHAGSIEQVYTPMGAVFSQTGKDLTRVQKVIATGGAIIHAGVPAAIAAHALHSVAHPAALLPKRADIYVDSRYILAAMGLLGEQHADCALRIMKKELNDHGTCEQAAR